MYIYTHIDIDIDITDIDTDTDIDIDVDIDTYIHTYRHTSIHVCQSFRIFLLRTMGHRSEQRAVSLGLATCRWKSTEAKSRSGT